jgi:hypothetical protein
VEKMRTIAQPKIFRDFSTWSRARLLPRKEGASLRLGGHADFSEA